MEVVEISAKQFTSVPAQQPTPANHARNEHMIKTKQGDMYLASDAAEKRWICVKYVIE